MNRKSAVVMCALTSALALAGAGCSNSPNGNQQQYPSNAATAAATAPAPGYTAAQPMAGTSTAQPATNGSAGAAGMSPGFDAVAGSKGYITQQDAQRVPWLQSHFSQCDANGDGRVDRQEYGQCRQGPMQNTVQPQGASTSG